MTTDPLPSWNDGPTKDTLVDLLHGVADIDPARRVAVFDNDGTLWCEKPNYTQFDFLVGELLEAVATTPELRVRPEYAALLDGDAEAMHAVGLIPIAHALVELSRGMGPEAFDQRVRAFFDNAVHASGRSYRALTYAPMVELLDALRDAGITPFLVTGGGAEFVRAVCEELYAIPQWHVVGTTVTYDVDDVEGVPVLRRTAQVLGDPNEGDAKVSNIRLHLGTRPILAAGNSAGDARMLDYVLGADGDGVALLVDHDDDEREYAYESVAGTFEAEPVLETARRRGWTVASMRNDWNRMFE
jgi:phosphoglycolate phosphatase-like HAD superfamily hydrolase